MKKEIIIKNHPQGQLEVVVFPENKIEARKDANEQKITNEIDIIELRITDVDGNKMPLQMTPDEALEISSLLLSGVRYYMTEFNEEYRKFFTKKIKKMDKRRNKK